MKLHFGVDDQPYDYDKNLGRTTGDIARILEDEYGIMRTFYRDKITAIKAIVLKKLMKGQQAPMDLPEVVTMLREYIDTGGFEFTGYALEGYRVVNGKIKKGVDPGRPSFRLSDTFYDSIRIWIE